MAYLHFIRLAWPLGLMLLLQNLVYGFMSNEMSSTRYFTDKGLLPPLSLRQKASNQTTISSSDSPSTLYTTGTSVPLQGCRVPVTYTNDPKSVYRWLSDHLPYEGCTIGFDVESLPKTRLKKGDKSPFDKAATVQLATSESCLVIHLARRSGKHSMACAPILKAILCDKQFVKAGCALDEDLMALYELWDGLDAKSRLDLGFLGGTKRSNRFGLKTLSKGLLEVDLPKPKEVAVSDWSAVPLVENQIVYSARDAWAGAAIAEKLAKYDPNTFSHGELIRYLPQIEPSISDLVAKQRRRNLAKRDLEQLLALYRSKMSEVPEDVQSKIHNLRGLIKTRVIDPHLIFEVEDLVNMED